MMASVVVGGNRKKSLTLRGVDPETCMIVFKNHWMQVVKISEKHEPSRSTSRALSFLSGQHGNNTSSSKTFHSGPIPADEASAVQNYVEHMSFLSMEEEAGQEGAMGPISEFVVSEGVMERSFSWSSRRQFTEDMKSEQLRMYQMSLSQAKQPSSHHKPVLRPLMMSLTSCAGAATDTGGVVEAESVQSSNQLCVASVKDPSVSESFFHSSQDQGAANFSLFSSLIPYTHRQGSVGQQARDASSLIMSSSASEPRVAQHIAENTYFCPVSATGSSGSYSSLPARSQVYSEDWHCSEAADWQQVPALVHFSHSSDFCSAVTKVAHPSIRSQLLSYIHNGFSVPVLAPALHKSTVEEVMATTAYSDSFSRSISEPASSQTFLSFISSHRHDNVQILDTSVSRINTPFQLGTVSSASFRTSIGLFCEDVMSQSVFRYSIPCSHSSMKQRRSLKQRDCYSSSAASFSLLMPSWCPVYLNSTHSLSEHIHWPKGADSSVSDSVGFCRGSDFSMDVNYIHYLLDARQSISISYRACRFWSAAYDGFDPPPQEYRSETPGDDIEDEEEFIQRLKSDSICSLVVLHPPSALSPTPSSSDTVSTSNQAGRVSSAMESEWDDIFAEEDLSSSPAFFNLANRCVESDGCRFSPVHPPPSPPRHIQEMRLTATKSVRGAYVEESEFQDDVIAYDLVAQKDTKTASFERMRAANRPSRENFSKSQRVSAAATTSSTAGRTVMEAVNSIMSIRRKSEDGGKEERRKSEDCGVSLRMNSEWLGNGTKEKEDGEPYVVFNGFGVRNPIISEFDDSDQETDTAASNGYSHITHDKQIHPKAGLTPSLGTNNLTNGHLEPVPRRLSTINTQTSIPPDNNRLAKNDFSSQYYELMLSLGVDPDSDDLTDDIGAFRRRVRASRQKLAEEEEQLISGFCSWWDEAEQEEEAEAMEEEEEEGSKRRGVPFTGPFISVSLSRSETLSENSISVNSSVTGISAQLASYPQPSSRSFSLSTETHDQHSVRTLYQVLESVHAQIERYVEDRPEFPASVTQAWRFLLAKDQHGKFREALESQGGDIISDPSLPNGSVRNASPSPPLSVLPPCPPIPPQAKSRVFAIVSYAEFSKESAAIAQEHSIASDCCSEE